MLKKKGAKHFTPYAKTITFLCMQIKMGSAQWSKFV